MSEEIIEPEARKDVVPKKEDLEREKLLLEIEQLKEAWWKKPAYVLAALPTLLAVLSLIYGFANGYFQATATKLENQKHDLQVEKSKLEADIKEFSQEKEELVQQNKDLARRNEELTIELSKYEQRKKTLMEEIAELLLKQNPEKYSPMRSR